MRSIPKLVVHSLASHLPATGMLVHTTYALDYAGPAQEVLVTRECGMLRCTSDVAIYIIAILQVE